MPYSLILLQSLGYEIKVTDLSQEIWLNIDRVRQKEAQKVKGKFKPKVPETPVVCNLKILEKRHSGAGSREREKVERS